MKKSLIFACILLLVGTLVACTTTQSTTRQGSTGQRPAGQDGTTNASSQPKELPIDSVVGIGILKLEGTDQAIDADKAAELLPLFRALKSLSTNSNTAVDEITALNKQIKNSLTADQLTAITNLKLTISDVRTMMVANGLQTSGPSSNSSSSSSSQGNREFGGPGGGFFMGVGNGTSGNSSSSVQATPNAAAAMNISRKTAGGYNLTFADVVIKLLESKIKK
jgi:hypothetical protein